MNWNEVKLTETIVAPVSLCALGCDHVIFSPLIYCTPCHAFSCSCKFCIFIEHISNDNINI